MGKWAIIFGGCWWLLHEQVAATTNAAMGNVGTTQAMANPVATTAMVVDPMAGYTKMDSPSGACRANPTSGGRDRTRHEVTLVSSAEECGKFCNHIKPCWGFEFDIRPEILSPSAEDYGNCEIWDKMEIAPGNTFTSTIHVCYKKTTNPGNTVDQPTVSADFNITNLNFTAMESNQTFLASLAAELALVIDPYLTPAVMKVVSSASNPMVKKLGSDLMVRMVFTPNGTTTSAEVHNYVRLFSSQKKRVHNGWNVALTQTNDAGLPEAIAGYFEGLTGMTLGTPQVTMEMVTLTPLAVALQGQALAFGGNNPGGNNPGGNNPGGGNPGGSTTVRTTSSGYASVPLLFLVLLCLPKI